LQIESLLERRPAQLSGGQRQRVAMGRALAREPQIFLFDEPLSNLDAKLRVEMRSEIKLLHKRLGITTVYVTHDQIEAMTLGDKIAVMKDGVVQQFGTPDDIYNRPVNTFVAGFMGSPPMNLIPATVRVEGGIVVTQIAAHGKQQSFSLPLRHIAPGDLPSGSPLEVLLGVRPEHMTDALRVDTSHERVTVHVDITERTGADTLAFVALGGERCVCRLNPLAPIHEHQVELAVDTRAAVLFDRATGRALTLPSR